MRAACILSLLVMMPTASRGQSMLLLHGEDRGSDMAVRGSWASAVDTTWLFEATWNGVNGAVPTYTVRHGQLPEEGVRLMLDRLVEVALGAYLDSRVRFTRDGVRSALPPEMIVHEMDGIVSAACEAHGVATGFGGFSDPTIAQLGRLLRIDWSRMTSPIDAGAEQDKYLTIYRYVRGQREELERSLRADLLPLAAVEVIGHEEPSAVRGSEIRINSTCGTVFDEENLLCALDLRLADAGPGGVDPRPDPTLWQGMEERMRAPAEVSAPIKVRKRDRWLKGELDQINERIGAIDQRKELWALRDRMDDLEDRLSGLDMEVRALGEGRSAGNPIADLSDLTGRNITVRFERNAVGLDPAARVLLNEVFEQLARSPLDKVLITGYTDRSGDPGVNLLLSEKRARSVRNYLLLRGIAAERLLVNFYGDSRSTGRDPNERRVEVEWLR